MWENLARINSHVGKYDVHFLLSDNLAVILLIQDRKKREKPQKIQTQFIIVRINKVTEEKYRKTRKP